MPGIESTQEFHDVELGQRRKFLVTGTSSVNLGNMGLRGIAVQPVNGNATISSLTDETLDSRSSGFSDETFADGTVIYGSFTEITLSSGRVIVYTDAKV